MGLPGIALQHDHRWLLRPQHKKKGPAEPGLSQFSSNPRIT